MSQRGKAAAAVALGILALAILAANLTLVWTLEAAGSAGRPPAATLWLFGLAGAPIVGMIIAGRRPDSSYGWLLIPRLRDELELEALTRGLLDVVASTMQPQRVGVWLRPVEAGRR